VEHLAVAQRLRQPARLCSLSRQRLASRSACDDHLSAAQRGDLDATARVRWFATRDLADLVARKLVMAKGVGKSVRCDVAVPGWTHGVLAADQRDQAR